MRGIGQGSLIEQLASRTGWLLISREGDRHKFVADDHTSRQVILVRHSQGSLSAVFQSWLPVSFPADKAPMGLFARLLLRNNDLLYAKWGITLDGSCEVSPYVGARLPLAALNPAMFDGVAREMVNEVADFHRELREKFRGGYADSGGAATLGQAHSGQGYLPGQSQGMRYLEP